jgi:hypothetical protein
MLVFTVRCKTDDDDHVTGKTNARCAVCVKSESDVLTLNN